MRKTKSFFCIILCVITVFLFPAVVFAGSEDLLTSKPLHFDENGKLRIMHVTDTHLYYKNVNDTVKLLSIACDREKPDVVILTGDNAMENGEDEIRYCIDKLMNVFEKRKIPVAVTLGNHDSRSCFTREELMEIYNSYSCSISVDDGELLPNCGTYRVPVLGSFDGKLKFNLWVFDCGENDSKGHYSNPRAEQVEWFEKTDKMLEADNGKKINGIVFQHVIVPEIYDALSRSKLWGAYKFPNMYDDGYYYYFNQNGENRGMIAEKPCCGYTNYGEFSAMVERGDILAMFTGHDHRNSFSVNHKGIDICNTVSSRYNRIPFSSQYGYRIIDIDENNTSEYTSRVVHWYDFFDADDIADYLLTGDFESLKTALNISFVSFFEKALIDFSSTVTKIFTSRTTEYY